MAAIEALRAAAAQGLQGARQETKLPGSPFQGMLSSLLKQSGELDQTAQQSVNGLLTGQGVEVHEAMIATQKADMAFELALQVRNKAVGAYQQMMQMQF